MSFSPYREKVMITLRTVQYVFIQSSGGRVRARVTSVIRLGT